MFDDEIYEVTRDEFKGFIDQIKPECYEYETHYTCDENTFNPNFHEVKIVSKDGDRIFAKVTSDTEEVHYYVYEMPHDDERRAAKTVRKIILETPEEVKAFFDALNKLHKEKDYD